MADEIFLIRVNMVVGYMLKLKEFSLIFLWTISVVFFILTFSDDVLQNEILLPKIRWNSIKAFQSEIGTERETLLN